MLNKSLPYKNIIMQISADDIKKSDEPTLPQGFTFCFFENGMESDWARIETSVLEFDLETEALDYFKRDYCPFENELKRRCVFIKNADGLAVATANAWFSKSEKLGYQPQIHWVAVHPDFQGLGLGKAVIAKAVRVFLETDSGSNVLLHTQTWSDKAVDMYIKTGFHFCKEKEFALMQNGGRDIKILGNDYNEALEVLKGHISEETYDTIIKTSK